MEPAAGCLSDHTLAQLVDDELPAPRRAELLAHISACEGCCKLVAAVMRPNAPPPAPPAAAEWAPPPEIDEFRLEQKLGQGAMGVVYRAWDRSLERRVALKFIASEDPEQRALQANEARLLARLQHPNVVAVYRVGQTAGRPYIVSEYVEGQSLQEIGGKLPWRRVLALALGLARGLQAAHGQNVLHRDIKPSNVMVTQDDQVKLLDFGLAVPHRPASGGITEAAGTPRYMAPELFEGAPVSPRSDLYSLGLVLAELLTGERPARGGPRTAAEALAGLEAGVDPDFTDLVARCLEPDPLRRPASAEALAEAFQRLKDALPAAVELPPDNPYRGLAPFEEEHQAVFLGRGGDIRAVADRLSRQPVVLIAGDSGVGKSSLCRAGVLPFLSAQARAGGRRLTCLIVVPGRRPLQALAAAIAPWLGRPEAVVGRALEESPASAARDVREESARHPERGELLLFVDQLEEMVTLAEPADAAHFATFLGELSLQGAGVRLLLAVRGDYMTRIGALPRLGDEVQGAFHLLRHMSPEGLREAVVGPARSRGVVFESRELIQHLVDSATGPGSLPLLQFALAELWERRDRLLQRITRAELDAMGGVAGALSRHADRVLAALDRTRLSAARQVLLRLVTPERTRNERAAQELAPASDARRQEILRALVDGRLIHVRAEEGRATYQIAHDSLIGEWATLHGWLDEDTGLSPIRHRLEAASAEWERLGHPPDALAGLHLLEEAGRIDASSLEVRERRFLEESRRAERRRRRIRWTAILAPVVVAAAVAAGFLVQIRRDSRRFAAAKVAEARQALDLARRRGAEAGARREEAMALFDGRSPAGSARAPDELWQAAEERWGTSLESLEQASAAYASADRSLERALQRIPDRPEALVELAGLLRERLLLSELFHQSPAADLARLEDLAARAPRLVKGLSDPARLDLDTEPPGALVEISLLANASGARDPVPVPELGPQPLRAPLRDLQLRPGSYLLHLRHPDRPPVVLPLLLSRGDRERLRVPLPAAVPEGFVHVPAGCFLIGAAQFEEVRRFLNAPPMHRVCLDHGFLISRTEVTFGDWIAYLDSLPPDAPARRLFEQPRYGVSGVAVTLRHRPREGWVFSFLRQGNRPLSAAVGVPLRYPGRPRRASADWTRFPLVGASSEDLSAYFFWLDRSGRLPGARLCTEHEWERAARGADDRAYPHGDRLDPDDANIDVTYGRQPTSMGLDEVGSHPRSQSLFGLQDMAGNALELVRPSTEGLGRVVLRGGAFYYDRTAAMIACRQPAEPTMRDATTGVRICAPSASR